MTKNTRTPSTARKGRTTRGDPMGKPAVPPRWPNTTREIDNARSPSRLGIRPDCLSKNRAPPRGAQLRVESASRLVNGLALSLTPPLHAGERALREGDGAGA